MAPPQWRRVEELYESAVRLEPGRRRAFLADACAGDEPLRQEVESLLAAFEQARDFLDTPALEVMAAASSTDEAPAEPQALPAGLRIGPYLILGALGRGGMGEVYQATDTRLGRDVALKFLPEESARDAHALERFTREARAVSALNHPHICVLHDIGEHQGRPFLVLELLEGQSLKDRLAAGPLPPGEVLELALQIAGALEAAHARGIIHRDIKPGNIFLTGAGHAKILDFGLVKLLWDKPPGLSDASIATGEDKAGAISHTAMGTLSYASPEQARGEQVDARTDLFSLGVTLYEAATRCSPFHRATPEATLEAVLQHQPAGVCALNPRIPAGLDRILTKALEKDRTARHQSAAALKADLERLKPALESPGKHARRWLLAAALLAATVPAYLLLYRSPPRETAPLVRSLAVLPLQNASGDPQQDYLADGLTEALTGSLGRISALRVTSRASAMQYKLTKKPLPEIARQLGVDAVARGSMTRFGDRVRVSLELIQVSTGRQLWAETYERDLGQVPAWQSEVASAVAREVKLKVTPAEAARLAGPRPVNRDAFESFLRGRNWLDKRNQEAIRRAIEYFRKAIDEDPAYAPAYAGLADSYNQLGTVVIGSEPPSKSRPLAAAAAARALEIDSDLAEAHAALGFAKLYDWNWSGAEQSLRRAIELNPSYAPVRIWHASLLVCTGRTGEAVGEARRAEQLDPLSLIVITQVGWIFAYDRRYDEAIQQYLKALETDPNYLWALHQLGGAYTCQSRFEEAIRTHEKAATVSGRTPAALGGLAYTYGVAGRAAEARKVVAELIELSKRQYVPPASVAWGYFGLGDSDRGFEWLEKAYQERSNAIAYLAASTNYDRVRSDPRYLDLLRRIGLGK